MHPTVTFNGQNRVSSHSSVTYCVLLPVQKVFIFIYIHFYPFSAIAFFLACISFFYFFPAISKQHQIISIQKFFHTTDSYIFCNFISTSSQLSPSSTKSSAYRSSFTPPILTSFVISSITTANKR